MEKEKAEVVLKRHQGTRTIPDIWAITASFKDQEWGAAISTNHLTRESFGALLVLIADAVASNTDKRV